MPDVSPAEPLREQNFDRIANEAIRLMPEERQHLAVGEDDLAARVDDDHRIGCGVEDAPDKLGREHAHGFVRCGGRR